MATEVIRCSECGTVFKGVPHWLASAKVMFTCTSCPKKGTRNLARFEPAIDARSSSHDSDNDPELEAVDLDDLDETDLELADEEIDPDAD